MVYNHPYIDYRVILPAAGAGLAQQITEVFPLKKTGKYVLSALVVILAGVMAFQAVALSPGALSGSKAAAACAPGTVVVKTVSQKADAPAAPQKADKAETAETPDAPAAQKTAAPAAAPVSMQSGAVVQAVGDETPFGTQIIPGVYYNEEDQMIQGPNGAGMVYLGYDYDITNGVFCTSMYPWQRNFGFMKIYDSASPIITIIYDTMRIKFDYNGLNWMVQFWKGQYGITSGAEVGVYTKEPDSATPLFYDCASDENRLVMSMNVYKDGEFYFKRDEQLHWWLTGFVMGEIVSYKRLSMDATLTMKDEEMRDAFVTALEAKGYTVGLDCRVNGLKVTVDW